MGCCPYLHCGWEAANIHVNLGPARHKAQHLHPRVKVLVHQEHEGANNGADDTHIDAKGENSHEGDSKLQEVCANSLRWASNGRLGVECEAAAWLLEWWGRQAVCSSPSTSSGHWQT